MAAGAQEEGGLWLWKGQPGCPGHGQGQDQGRPHRRDIWKQPLQLLQARGAL